MTPHDVTLRDQSDQDWSVAQQLDAGLVMVTLRGDW